MKQTGIRFGVLCGSMGLPVPAEEYRFHGTRKWRFDYAWVPQRIGFATAVYTNGLLIGEILPAGLTIPLVLPLLHQSWQ